MGREEDCLMELLILGMFTKKGIHAFPLYDGNGKFTNQIVVHRPSGKYLITIDSMEDIT